MLLFLPDYAYLLLIVNCGLLRLLPGYGGKPLCEGTCEVRVPIEPGVADCGAIGRLYLAALLPTAVGPGWPPIWILESRLLLRIDAAATWGLCIEEDYCI